MQYSNDGATWGNAPTATWLTTDEVTVGMFVLAGNYASTETANFTNVTLTGGMVPVVQPVAHCASARHLEARWSPAGRLLRLEGLPDAHAEISVVDGAGRTILRAQATGPACSLGLPVSAGAVCLVRVRQGAGEAVRVVVLR